MAALQFSEGKVAPPGARIVYIDGAFDLFHPGHVEILKVRRIYSILALVSRARGPPREQSVILIPLQSTGSQSNFMSPCVPMPVHWDEAA